MAKPSPQGELFPAEVPGDDVAILSSRCRLLREGEQTVVVVCGAPVAHFKETDRLAKANVMVMLVEHGWATQVEVARAFACDVRTVRRAQTRYDEGGLAALGRAIGFPKGRRRDRARDRRVAELRASGCSQREIARRLGCDEKAVRKRLRRLVSAAKTRFGMGNPSDSVTGPSSASGQTGREVEGGHRATGCLSPNLC